MGNDLRLEGTITGPENAMEVISKMLGGATGKCGGCILDNGVDLRSRCIPVPATWEEDGADFPSYDLSLKAASTGRAHVCFIYIWEHADGEYRYGLRRSQGTPSRASWGSLLTLPSPRIRRSPRGSPSACPEQDDAALRPLDESRQTRRARGAKHERHGRVRRSGGHRIRRGRRARGQCGAHAGAHSDAVGDADGCACHGRPRRREGRVHARRGASGPVHRMFPRNVPSDASMECSIGCYRNNVPSDVSMEWSIRHFHWNAPSDVSMGVPVPGEALPVLRPVPFDVSHGMFRRVLR